MNMSCLVYGPLAKSLFTFYHSIRPGIEFYGPSAYVDSSPIFLQYCLHLTFKVMNILAVVAAVVTLVAAVVVMTIVTTITANMLTCTVNKD